MVWTPANKSSNPTYPPTSKSSASSWNGQSHSLSGNDFLLLEDGFYLLLEDGFKLILEQSTPGPGTWTPLNKS